MYLRELHLSVFAVQLLDRPSLQNIRATAPEPHRIDAHEQKVRFYK